MCIYDSRPEEFERMVKGYISRQLSESEEKAFEEHISKCDSCFENVVFESSIARYSELENTYRSLQIAVKARKYPTVHDLVRKMISLGYDERDFPVKKLVAPMIKYLFYLTENLPLFRSSAEHKSHKNSAQSDSHKLKRRR